MVLVEQRKVILFTNLWALKDIGDIQKRPCRNCMIMDCLLSQRTISRRSITKNRLDNQEKSYDLVGYRFLNFFRNFLSSEINGLQSIRQSQKYKSLDKDAQDDDSFDKDALILDFFSGSATTAHAVMQLNAEDGGNRKYICVQLPEKTPEDSEARKAGYATIPEIAKERIRRSGAKIKADSSLTTQNLDTGFRVYRLDESNYEKVSLSPKEYKQDQLDLFAYNIKRDRTDLDLLYGSMLAWGVRLDLPLQTETMDGCTIYTVNEGELVACFSEGITDKVVTAMADKSPLRVLFRDACFKEDAQKINIYEQFKQSLDWSDNDAFNNIRVI